MHECACDYGFAIAAANSDSGRRGVRVQHTERSDGQLACSVIQQAPDSAEAEQELCRRFARRVHLYGLRHLRDEAAADDLVQAVLSVVLRKLRAGEVREPERIASFVLGTARTLSRTATRSQRLEREVLDETRLAASVPPPADPLARRHLIAALDQLEERERSVVVLTFFGQQTSEEIARSLGIAPGNVRVIRHRAIARLRRAMHLDEEQCT